MSYDRTSGENMKNAIEPEIIRSKRKTLSLESVGTVLIDFPLTERCQKEPSPLTSRWRIVSGGV